MFTRGRLLLIAAGTALIVSGFAIKFLFEDVGTAPRYVVGCGIAVLLITFRFMRPKPRPGAEPWHRNGNAVHLG